MNEPLLTCADCGCPLTIDSHPPYGWELEDGRSICNECCVADTVRIAAAFTTYLEPLA
jgi:hypothetical protein